MSWYKISSGMPQDAKLALIARRTGFRRGEVLALWIALLDHACNAAQRGSVKDIDPEEIAAALEFDITTVETVINVLYDKKMILPEGLLAGWSKNQKLSTPRTRAYRARASSATAVHESEADRRQRLQNEISVRHKKRGRTLVKQL